MESARCKAYLESIERGSITAAADALGYTPSAVSQLVTSLEKELGLKLLVRSQRGVKPTSEGESIAAVFRAYLRQEQEIYRHAAELRGVVSGKLSIAAYPSIATNWLPEIVREYKANYPGVQINIMESIRQDIFRLFEENTADLAFMAYSEPMPFDWIPLAEEEVIAVIPEDNPLAEESAFPVKECEKYDFIMGSWGKEKEIMDILHRNHVHPEIKYTTFDTPATLALVRMGLGISFVNELSAQYWDEHIVKMPLDPPARIGFGIAIPSRENMTSAARKFLSCTVRHFEK